VPAFEFTLLVEGPSGEWRTDSTHNTRDAAQMRAVGAFQEGARAAMIQKVRLVREVVAVERLSPGRYT
jgi:hypothetical protein